MTDYFAPEPLGDHHHLDGFTCGVESLDTWLHKRARANSGTGASRTYVVADDQNAVVAYYSLNAGAVMRTELPRKMRPHGTPNPVPVLVIGRFAVHSEAQGNGIGASMLQDALTRCANLSEKVGFMAVVVHPVDEKADGFWRYFGFKDSPIEEPQLLLPIAELLPYRSEAAAPTD